MKRYEMIKSKELFNSIIKNGNKNKNDSYIIFYTKSENYKPNFGLAVSKKMGNSVIRNKIKRQIRNIIDNNKLLFKNNYNYIIMVRKDFINNNYKVNEELMIDLIRKVKYEK